MQTVVDEMGQTASCKCSAGPICFCLDGVRKMRRFLLAHAFVPNSQDLQEGCPLHFITNFGCFPVHTVDGHV